jgi:DNA polymerase-3 subunit delta
MAAKSNPTFYIFHGSDDLSLQEALDKLRRDADDLNTSEFEGQNTNVHEVINAVSSYPFLADKRLVIVKGMLEWITRKGAGETGKKAVTVLVESLPQLPDYARLVFVERTTLSDNDKLVKLAQSDPNGYVKNFSMPKDLSQWIIQRAKEYEAEIAPRAAFALAEVVSGDLRRADNELYKLVNYVEAGQTILEEDVAALTPYVAEANIFKMTDALGMGNGKLAMQLMHRLLEEKDNDPFSLFGMITRQFRLLLLAKEHLTTSGGGPNSLAGAIKVAPFVAQNLAKQTRAFSLPQLEQIYQLLLEYDLKMKTGQLKPDLALDLLVSSLAG